MSNEHNPDYDADQPMAYQIRLKGHLDRQWTDWFEDLTITLAGNGETLLTGPVVDQAALFGLLRKVRDLGMPLIAVMRVEPGPSTTLTKWPVDEVAQRGQASQRPPTRRGPSALDGTGQTTASDVKP